ncbi:hypothetical protein Anas_13414 [Armadillidium nasatum]|uniref:Uncharacterized protein n=1 Tax=Armadillidium nasatum TaxID=96803 RepID=A0A5N5T1X4_9CRUS|nr:hypothetical protein Anas_13414 [Armadillidium nasatum]
MLKAQIYELVVLTPVTAKSHCTKHLNLIVLGNFPLHFNLSSNWVSERNDMIRTNVMIGVLNIARDPPKSPLREGNKGSKVELEERIIKLEAQNVQLKNILHNSSDKSLNQNKLTKKVKNSKPFNFSSVISHRTQNKKNKISIPYK